MGSTEAVIEGVPLAQFAAVTAALSEGFPLRAVLSVEGLDSARWTEADRGWTERLDSDPQLLAHYEAELANAQARLLSTEEIPQEEGAAAKPMRVGNARLVPSRMRFGAPSLDAGPRPTFAIPNAVPVVPPPVPLPAAPPGTVELPAMPELQKPPRPDLEPPRYDSGSGRTHVVFNKPAEVFPFRPAAPGEAPPASVSRGVSWGEPSRPRPATDEDSTQIAFKVPQRDLPFKSAAPSIEFEDALNAPAAKAGAGSDGRTMAIVGAEALRALPLADAPAWAANPPAPPPPAPPPPAPPSPAPRAPTRPVTTTEPVMSVERHASLCLEIALDPTHQVEALARYQVTAADKARADEYYRARIAVDPDLGAQWNHAYTAYHAWYTSRSRP